MSHEHQGGIMRWLKGLMLRHVHKMITCAEFESFVLQYLDGDLPEKQRYVFELHLKLCRECREYLAAYRRSMEITEAVLTRPDAPVPGDVPEDLVRAILDAREQ